jgi:hypothetical protein
MMTYQHRPSLPLASVLFRVVSERAGSVICTEHDVPRLRVHFESLTEVRGSRNGSESRQICLFMLLGSIADGLIFEVRSTYRYHRASKYPLWESGPTQLN